MCPLPERHAIFFHRLKPAFSKQQKAYPQVLQKLCTIKDFNIFAFFNINYFCCLKEGRKQNSNCLRVSKLGINLALENVNRIVSLEMITSVLATLRSSKSVSAWCNSLQTKYCLINRYSACEELHKCMLFYAVQILFITFKALLACSHMLCARRSRVSPKLQVTHFRICDFKSQGHSFRANQIERQNKALKEL